MTGISEACLADILIIGAGLAGAAAALGLTYVATGRLDAYIERGINWPSMPVYLKLCRVLRIALPKLLK